MKWLQQHSCDFVLAIKNIFLASWDIIGGWWGIESIFGWFRIVWIINNKRNDLYSLNRWWTVVENLFLPHHTLELKLITEIAHCIRFLTFLNKIAAHWMVITGLEYTTMPIAFNRLGVCLPYPHIQSIPNSQPKIHSQR